MKDKIIEWVKDPKRDYNEGVDLLAKVCTNKSLVRYFQNTSERFGVKKLIYELGKYAGKMPVVETKPKEVEEKKEVPTFKDDNSVGGIAKKIVHDTWVEISRINEEIFKLGNGNDEATKAKRVALMDERQPLIERYNEVYEAKEEFYNGKKSEAELQQVIDGTAKAPKVVEQKASDVTMGDAALIKRLHALKTNITRSQNQLDYQQPKRGKEKNPMPDCPKRREIEAKLKAMQSELDTLTAEKERRSI